MKFAIFAIGFTAVVATAYGSVAPVVIPATTLLRTPQYDSAVVHSDRVGGSFAYSTIEGHAYQAVPQIIPSAYQPFEYRYLNTVPLPLPTHNYYVPNYVVSNLHPLQPAEIPTDVGSGRPISPPPTAEEPAVPVPSPNPDAEEVPPTTEREDKPAEEEPKKESDEDTESVEAA